MAAAAPLEASTGPVSAAAASGALTRTTASTAASPLSTTRSGTIAPAAVSNTTFERAPGIPIRGPRRWNAGCTSRRTGESPSWRAPRSADRGSPCRRSSLRRAAPASARRRQRTADRRSAAARVDNTEASFPKRVMPFSGCVIGVSCGMAAGRVPARAGGSVTRGIGITSPVGSVRGLPSRSAAVTSVSYAGRLVRFMPGPGAFGARRAVLVQSSVPGCSALRVPWGSRLLSVA